MFRSISSAAVCISLAIAMAMAFHLRAAPVADGALPTKPHLVSYQAAKKLIKLSEHTGMVMGHMVMYSGKEVHVVVVANQPGLKDMTFAVHGLVNPELDVPAGAKVSLTLINMDFGGGMAHGVVIGKLAPPYGVSVPSPLPGQIAQIPLLAPRSKQTRSQAKYYVDTVKFTAKKPGTYYYLCQMPTHAKMFKMYGKFVITPGH